MKAFTACILQIVMHEVLRIVAGFVSLDCFPGNTALVCRSSVPYRGVTPGTPDPDPLRAVTLTARQRTTNAIDHKHNEPQIG